MKHLLAVATLAISTLFASAPARAMDVGTALAIQSGASVLNTVLRANMNQNRRPPACRRPYVPNRYGQCVPPVRGYNAHRGSYPATYLPPNIPGSPGYVQPAYVAPVARQHSAPEVSGEGTCKIKGTVYVEQIGACVRSVRDVTELQRIVPDLAVDPECRGKPPGFKFDREVTGLRGERGIDHRVCGSRR